MSKIYGVGLITRTQMRDITLDCVLGNSEYDSDSYIHEGDFSYIFTLNNTLSPELTNQTLVYKTLGGARRLRGRFSGDWELKLRYALRDSNGMYVKSLKNDTLHEIVIIDITEKWDSLIDKRIELKRETFKKDVERLKSKKSK